MDTPNARTMIGAQLNELDDLAKEAQRLRSFHEHYETLKRWKARTVRLLKEHVSSDEGANFEKVEKRVWARNDELGNFLDELEMHSGSLKALDREIALHPEQVLAPQGPPAPVSLAASTRPSEPSTGVKVFIVHGHDEAVLGDVEMFLRRGRVTPVILHREANAGRTIIEKFEAHAANVGFAIVLLTADDRGGPKPPQAGKTVMKWKFAPKKRARQNVVFELGFFFAALGRKRVCALHEHGVELPSDLHGVVYVELKGDWKGQVARELVDAGIAFDALNALG